MEARHELLGGKIQLFKRPRSPFWQCSATVGGRQFKKSTGEESLAQAKDIAEDWYLTLKGLDRFGGGIPKSTPKEKPKEHLFRDAAAKFVAEFALLTDGQRSASYVTTIRETIDRHLNPFFGDMSCPEITDNTVQDYRVHRAKAVDKKGEPRPPARSTMHGEIIALRHVLRTAKRSGWIQYLPDLSAPYKASGKIRHRAWFSLDEYTALRKATAARAKKPPKPKWAWECKQLHDYVLFMANTGLRPDEAARLEFRDVVIVDDDATGEKICEIEVRGKRGVGYCKSMPGAVRPFERARDRPRALPEERPGLTRDRRDAPASRRPYGTELKRSRSRDGFSRGTGAHTEVPKPTDRIFGPTQRELLNTILGELGLKYDRDGQIRTAYSLRHTYICFRLMEGADIYQIAKNCRTSVEMIEKYYASHIKNMLDTSAINVRRAKTVQTPAVGALTAEED